MPNYNNESQFNESNVNYLNKDFASFKTSLINYAQSYFPNSYRDFNESSPGMMLMEMSAYVGDVLSFYIDRQYQEMLLPLAEERKNVLSLAKMFGYKVKPIVPAFTELTFKSSVDAMSNDASLIDYSSAGIFDSGIKVTSTANPNIVFETLEPVDFTISASGDTEVIHDTDGDTGLITKYRLSRTVPAVSGETKSRTFTIGAPTKFLKLNLPDTDVVDILSVMDSNGNRWHEVDFLAQDKVPVSSHYTNDYARNSAYINNQTDAFPFSVPVPYSLTYISTNKKFTRETNLDNTTSLVFGNGILKNGTTITDGFIDLEQVGIIVPGQANDLNESINPLLGDEYSTLGETPMHITLTVTYRVGGGISSNSAVGDLQSLGTTSALPGSGTGASIISVNNNIPARGGMDQEQTTEIREKTRAFFTTQNRCVTKEDYEARVMNVPSKYGNIAKVYVDRSNHGDISTALEWLSNSIQALADNPSVAVANNVVSDWQSMAGYFTENNILPGVNIHILAYDKFKNLVGNPWTASPNSQKVPTLLKQNISHYLDNFRILTDTINIVDGYIINFGVFFEVVAHKYADKNQVKIQCIEKIKEYFTSEKMQFNQPIYVSQLEYELMNVDGVRAVNYVQISQHEENNVIVNPIPTYEQLPNPTYLYSVNEDTGDVTTDGGIDGYGWLYDFNAAYEDGMYLPPNPSNPAVFELKNPNQNIKGRVK